MNRHWPPINAKRLVVEEPSPYVIPLLERERYIFRNTVKRLFPDVCHAIGYHNARQAVALVEHFIPYARHAIRNRHTCQAGALVEHFTPDVCHAVRNRHACQTATAEKRRSPDDCNAVRNRHACQASATRECPLPNARHAIRNRNARKASAISERLIPDACHTVRNRHVRQRTATQKRGMPNALHAVGDCRARQAGAIVERGMPNARHAVWYRNARKASAISERRITDARHARRNRHACQAGALVERLIPDARHAVRNRHVRQAAATLERLIPDARHSTSEPYGLGLILVGNVIRALYHFRPVSEPRLLRVRHECFDLVFYPRLDFRRWSSKIYFYCHFGFLLCIVIYQKSNLKPISSFFPRLHLGVSQNNHLGDWGKGMTVRFHHFLSYTSIPDIHQTRAWNSDIPYLPPSALLVPRNYPSYIVRPYWICTVDMNRYVLASAEIEIVEASYVIPTLRLVIPSVMVCIDERNIFKCFAFMAPVYEVVYALEPLETSWGLPYVVNPYLYPVFWNVI